MSPTTAAHVREDLGKDVELVLEGGPSEVGIESTIVDLSGEAAVLLRPGRIAKEQLQAVIGPVGEKTAAAPRHSGGLERHYAPYRHKRQVPVWVRHLARRVIADAGADRLSPARYGLTPRRPATGTHRRGLRLCLWLAVIVGILLTGAASAPAGCRKDTASDRLRPAPGLIG